MFNVITGAALSQFSAAGRKTSSLFILGFLIFAQAIPLRAEPPDAADPVKPAPADVDDDITAIKKNAQSMVEQSFDKLGKPANRDFHSRGVCLKGTFTTLPQNLPQGVKLATDFLTKPAVYAMYGRFSNGFPGRDSDDRDPRGSVFGFAAKVLGAGEIKDKFDMQSLGSTKPKNQNQDWNMATGPTFPIPTAAIYRQNREMSPLEFGRHHPIIAGNVLAGLIHLDNYWQMSYHSQVAFHFGADHVAKFSVTPCDGIEKTISAIKALKRSRTYTTDDLITHIKNNEICFNFWAQSRLDDEKLPPEHSAWKKLYPKANPTKLWPKDIIRVAKVAEIKFRAQPQVEKLQDFCEQKLSFNPGNTLQDLRPIEEDDLTKSRYAGAYEGSVATRTKLNNKVQWEPPPVPADQLDKWLTAVE